MTFGFEFLCTNSDNDVAILRQMIMGARAHLGQNTSFVLLPANPRNKPSVNAILSAHILLESMQNSKDKHFKNIALVPTISANGLSELELKSQILSLKYANFSKVALIGGDSGTISGIALIKMVRDMLGEDIYIISGTANNVKSQKMRDKLCQKLESGANHIITQPLFDMNAASAMIATFNELKALVKRPNATLSLGVFGIFDTQSALAINSARLGFKIPKRYIDSMQLLGAQRAFKQLWQDMQALAASSHASLYLSTPKHNDLRAYGDFKLL